MVKTQETRKIKGFSLVELMVVVAIIGVLGSIVAFNVLKQARRANIEAAKAKLKEVSKACDTFKLNNKRWPQSIEELVQGDDAELSGGPKALNDPWGTPIVYVYDGIGNPPYDLISYGADKSPGGAPGTEDADIHLREVE